MERSAENDLSEDILEVTDTITDNDIFGKTTQLVLEDEDTLSQKGEAKNENSKGSDNKNEKNNNEENVKLNKNDNKKISTENNVEGKENSENTTIKNVDQIIKDNENNVEDHQNSTIINDFNNTAVKQVITTSTPYKQADNVKSKKVLKDLEERHLWVYNINPTTSAKKLKEDLSKFGNALVAKIVKNGGNYYGYALMENARCVQACIDNLHNKIIDDYQLELRSQAPNTRNQDNNGDESKSNNEERLCKKEKSTEKLIENQSDKQMKVVKGSETEKQKNLEKEPKESEKQIKAQEKSAKEGVKSAKKKNEENRPKKDPSRTDKQKCEKNKGDLSRERNKSGERKKTRSISSLEKVDDFRTFRKRSRSSDPLTLKVKDRKASPETAESRLRRMELEMERMRSRERDRERQFTRRIEREERTLFMKRQIENDRLKLNDERRKLEDEKLKLGDDRRKLEIERQKMSIEKRKFEEDEKRDRMEIERLQRKVRELEHKLEDERRKRKRSRSLSKSRLPARKTALMSSSKDNRIVVAPPRAVEDRPDPWSSIEGKKYYKESELKRYEEEKKKFRSEIHVVSSTSSSSRNNSTFAAGTSRRFESTVGFPPQQSRGYGEYEFHGRDNHSMTIPTVQSWNRQSYPPLHQSKPYQNEHFRTPYNSNRKY